MKRLSQPGANVALVPVKDLASAKSRLAPRLSSSERIELVERLLNHVLKVLVESPGIDSVVVVSPDQSILDQARRAGANALAEAELADCPQTLAAGTFRPTEEQLHVATELGHNAALDRARERLAFTQPASLLVTSADLPFLSPSDIQQMLALAKDEPVVVIAPDHLRQGTNVLLLRPPGAIPFRFGPNSLADHRYEAYTRGVRVETYESRGTAFDVDVPDDLEVLVER